MAASTTEVTPLLKDQSDIPRYNAASTSNGDATGEEKEPTVHEGIYEIPLLGIVHALCSVWEQNGAREELTPAVIMAMHLAYRRVTGGVQVYHSQYDIVNVLTDAMLRTIQHRQFFMHNDGLHAIQLRRSIFDKLMDNWPSIINYDEDLARNLNVYLPPTCRQRTRNFWTKCQMKYVALEGFLSSFSGQILFIIFILGWPLSLLIMGVMFMCQCPVNHFLPLGLLSIGLLGMVALKMRLVLACVEKWCWYRSRAVTSRFWNILKFLEFVFLLLSIIQLWLFLGNSPSFDPKSLDFCNETFYHFSVSMKYISITFASIWVFVYFIKLVFWVLKYQFNYSPLFDNDGSS